MIQAMSPLGHHLFQVPTAERIAQIPTKAQDDDLVLKVSPAKQCQPLVLHSLTIPDRTQRVCDRSVYRNNWFVLAQTDGAEYKPEPLPGWDESSALAKLAIDRIAFDDLDGNTQRVCDRPESGYQS